MTISLSSHVLDTTLGKPAANMQRCNQWQDTDFVAGIYQLRFHTKNYLLAHHGAAFYPFVDIHFELVENGGHYHVPLLISPYGFSSYRGS